MTILFILLLDTSITGIQIHELIGIGIFVLFIIHKLLNYKWIVAVTKNIFGKKTKLKTRIMYIMDVLILIAVTLTVLSGIFISKSLFTWITVSNTAFWKTIHSPVAYLSFILISIHLGLHWQYIMAAFRIMFKINKESVARKRILRIFALILAIAGIKSSIENNIAGKIVTPLLSGSSNTESQKETVSTSNASSTQTVTSASDNTTSTDSTQTVSSTQTTSTQTLEQYLGSLYCTGCGKHCSLLNPQCNIGEQQAEQATSDYNSGNTSSSSSSSTQTQSSTTSQPNSGGKGKGARREDQNTSSSETRPETGSASNTINQQASNTVTVYTSTSQIAGIFGEYIPIMGVWVAGVHYLVLALDKKKK